MEFLKLLFTTERLFGRQLIAGDLSEMLIVYGDIDAMTWVDDGDPLSLEDALRWIDITQLNYDRYGYGMTAILDKDTEAIIGFCGLVHPNGQKEVEIKYALKREFWGKGIATEAVCAMRDYGRRVHGIEHIIATTAPENKASHAVLEKSGFHRGALIENEDGSSTQVFDWFAADL